MKRRFVTLAALAAILGSAACGWAATTNSMLSLSAAVQPVATLTANTLALPVLPLSSTSSAVSAVTVLCMPGDTVTIALNAGENALSGQRRLTNGSAYINYELYQPTATGNAMSSPPIAWGDGGVTTAGSAFGAPCTGSAQVFNVYAQVPSGQVMPSGNYADAVTITLTY